MAIPDHARTNFDTLLRAARNGRLALMECHDARTGEPRYVLCAVARSDTSYAFTPFGHLAEGDPYQAYCPPDEPSGPDGEQACDSSPDIH